MSLNSSERESDSGTGIKRPSLSTIESSVTRLLVSTKHLLESLTQWAREEADDKYVSDAYVKLGNDFRAAIRAFSHSGIDVSDIGNVPQALRIILEAALSEEPSQENLDRFLPNIRNIIVTLLQNLKAKQAKAKALSHNSESIKPKHSPKFTRILSGEVKQSFEDRNTSNDALAQLQKGDVLQRRASKRFSAYQYAKLANTSVNSSALPRIGIDSESGSYEKSSTTKEEQHIKNTTDDNDDSKPNNETYIFLRLSNKTKKANVKLPISLAAIRLLFVEKFAYSPGSTSFPDVYIQDPESGVTYELEEHMLDELRPGTLLCLNETSSQLKVINDLASKIDVLSKKVELMNTEMISEVKDCISSIRNTTPAASNIAELPRSKSITGIKDIQKIATDLRAVRQSHSLFQDRVKGIIHDFKDQLQSFQERGLEVSKDSNRAYMESCHSKLSEDSDRLLTKVDDLQDIMEELRKDVAQRGVRVGEKQLKHTSKEIESVKLSHEKMATYIEKEKAVWKKIWEAELDKVCEEQQFFNLQDDLTRDLEEDIKKIEETFSLIEQCSSEQVKNMNSRRNKAIANLYIPEPGESLHDLKDAVLNQVAALRPDHERRLEAIERAEKIREKERQIMNISQFQEELGEFVEDNKLKKSGGIAELERKRMEKDKENLKSSLGVV